MHKLFIPWLVAVITSWAPPGRPQMTYPDATETAEEAVARYRSIASDALDVAYDESEAPLFGGAEWRARADTALMLLAVALKESGFRKDVDTGLGKMAKGDGGRSVCLMQINVGTGTVPVDGVIGTWGADTLLQDRKNCFRAALHLMRRSFRQCQGGSDLRLAAYASGSCDKGHQASQNRMRAFLRARDRYPLRLPVAR
jgi:hypothetical protein